MRIKDMLTETRLVRWMSEVLLKNHPTVEELRRRAVIMRIKGVLKEARMVR